MMCLFLSNVLTVFFIKNHCFFFLPDENLVFSLSSFDSNRPFHFPQKYFKYHNCFFIVFYFNFFF